MFAGRRVVGHALLELHSPGLLTDDGLGTRRAVVHTRNQIQLESPMSPTANPPRGVMERDVESGTGRKEQTETTGQRRLRRTDPPEKRIQPQDGYANCLV